ncbi:hypothetical protein CGRA01v4_14728 [Colletotrichum graminicola]|nr:hypothetical protein CGRA01v4_14728 [Colletotrichum graminicola]
MTRQPHNLEKGARRTLAQHTRQAFPPRALFPSKVQRSARSVPHPEASTSSSLLVSLSICLPTPLSPSPPPSRARFSSITCPTILEHVLSVDLKLGRPAHQHQSSRLDSCTHSFPFLSLPANTPSAGEQPVGSSRSRQPSPARRSRSSQAGIISEQSLNHLGGGVKHVDLIRQINQFRRVPTRRALSSTRYDTRQRTRRNLPGPRLSHTFTHSGR